MMFNKKSGFLLRHNIEPSCRLWFNAFTCSITAFTNIWILVKTFSSYPGITSGLQPRWFLMRNQWKSSAITSARCQNWRNNPFWSLRVIWPRPQPRRQLLWKLVYSFHNLLPWTQRECFVFDSLTFVEPMHNVLVIILLLMCHRPSLRKCIIETSCSHIQIIFLLAYLSQTNCLARTVVKP